MNPRRSPKRRGDEGTGAEMMKRIWNDLGVIKVTGEDIGVSQRIGRDIQMIAKEGIGHALAPVLRGNIENHDIDTGHQSESDLPHEMMRRRGRRDHIVLITARRSASGLPRRIT